MQQIHDVLDWFNGLLEEINNAISAAKETAAQALREDNDDRMRLFVERTIAMKKCMEHVKALRKEWATIETISIPRKHAIKNKKASPSTRIKKGEMTPDKDYVIPILGVLEAMGGRGEVKDVISHLYDVMKWQFKPVDLTPLSSSGENRWIKTANWARYNMKEGGLLKSNSPRGIWEISEKGREYLKKHGSHR